MGVRKDYLILNIYIYLKYLNNSVVSDSATPWIVAYQALTSMGFSRQECWSGLPFPSPGDLPNPGIELASPSLRADALPSEPPGKPFIYIYILWCQFKTAELPFPNP